MDTSTFNRKPKIKISIKIGFLQYTFQIFKNKNIMTQKIVNNTPTTKLLRLQP